MLTGRLPAPLWVRAHALPPCCSAALLCGGHQGALLVPQARGLDRGCPGQLGAAWRCTTTWARSLLSPAASPSRNLLPGTLEYNERVLQIPRVLPQSEAQIQAAIEQVGGRGGGQGLAGTAGGRREPPARGVSAQLHSCRTSPVPACSRGRRRRAQRRAPAPRLSWSPTRRRSWGWGDDAGHAAPRHRQQRAQRRLQTPACSITFDIASLGLDLACFPMPSVLSCIAAHARIGAP